jgi:hypothetical protein
MDFSMLYQQCLCQSDAKPEMFRDSVGRMEKEKKCPELLFIKSEYKSPGPLASSIPSTHKRGKGKWMSCAASRLYTARKSDNQRQMILDFPKEIRAQKKGR